jgi:hypothetical protein
MACDCLADETFWHANTLKQGYVRAVFFNHRKC